MPDQYIVEHASPTLAGLKTGNLFPVKLEKGRDICREIRDLNRTIRKKGLRAVLLQKTETKALVYLYRPDYLNRDLKRPEARRILDEKGYAQMNADRCIAELARHFEEEQAFPHEIGLFLGYPPEDVRGFMDDPRKGVKTVGFWKVYGNAEEARKTFSRFRKCTEIYRKEIENGKTLFQLAVRTNRRGDQV